MAKASVCFRNSEIGALLTNDPGYSARGLALPSTSATHTNDRVTRGDGLAASNDAADPAIASSETPNVSLCDRYVMAGGCDVAYVLFLEPMDENDARTSGAMDRFITSAIRAFTPDPTLVHCEVLLPPIPNSSGRRTHFATYMGQEAAWQSRDPATDDGIAFYLIDNATKWRAVPIFGSNAVESLRLACQSNVNAPYSMSRYLTSVPPLRGMARMLSDQPGSTGHCATIVARVLSQAHVGASLQHASAWYSPGTLYQELWNCLGDTQCLPAMSTKPIQSALLTKTKMSPVEALLDVPVSFEHVRALGESVCTQAIEELTRRVVQARVANGGHGRDEASRVAQKDLARGLLRWTLLRGDD